MEGDGAYQFGVETARETERLAAVERAFDPLSRWLLLEAGVRRGWRCWEVGAGNGSIARWLSAAVGPEGSVWATDLDDQRFDPGDTDVRFASHDILTDPLPAERFDLVHARFLLEHLPRPQLIVERLRQSVRSRGVVVLEDSAGLQIEVSPASPAFVELAGPWEAAGRAVGWDASYGLRLMSDLRDAGLTDLRGHEYRRLAPGGADWTHLSSGLERISERLVELGVAPEQLRSAIECLADPQRLITGPPVLLAQGRR